MFLITPTLMVNKQDAREVDFLFDQEGFTLTLPRLDEMRLELKDRLERREEYIEKLRECQIEEVPTSGRFIQQQESVAGHLRRGIEILEEWRLPLVDAVEACWQVEESHGIEFDEDEMLMLAQKQEKKQEKRREVSRRLVRNGF